MTDGISEAYGLFEGEPMPDSAVPRQWEAVLWTLQESAAPLTVVEIADQAWHWWGVAMSHASVSARLRELRRDGKVLCVGHRSPGRQGEWKVDR